MNTNRKVYLGLGLLCAIWAVGLMIVVVNFEGRYTQPDTGTYIEVAQSLLKIGSRYGASEHRTPGYPLFLTICYFLFGEYQVPVQIIQILIGAATVFLVSVMTLRIAGAIAALVTAFFFLLSPSFNPLVVNILTDALGMIIFALFFLCAIQVIYNPASSNRNLFWSGILLALAILVRPIFYYLVFPILPVLVVFLWWQHVSWGSIARKLACFALPLLVIIGSVQIRNAIVLGDSKYSSITGNIYPYFISSILEKLVAPRVAPKWTNYLHALRGNPCAGLNDPDPCFALGNPNWGTHSKQIVLMYIMENPFRTLHAVYENKLILFRYPDHNYFAFVFKVKYPSHLTKIQTFIQVLQGKEMAWFNFVGLAHKILLVFFSFVGLILWLFSELKHRFTAALALLIFMYFSMTQLAVVVDIPRYRLLIVPLLSMFAGVGVAAAFLWACKSWESLRERFARNVSPKA